MRSRILFLLALALVMVVAGDSSAAKPGLICGTPDDPIPCSTFNGGRCTYHYDAATNCCKAFTSGCLQQCC